MGDKYGDARWTQMILEAASLQIRKGESASFELAFSLAQTIIASMPGYISHELQRCIDHDDRYLLLVRWESVAAHEQGFRKSAGYQDWKRLLHHFYDPFPTVLHYDVVLSGGTTN
jgi:heme-degrading monooxygenase HmoA